MTGNETAAASAIVPGPALLTNTSAATMYSAICVINPSPITFTVESRRLFELSWECVCSEGPDPTSDSSITALFSSGVDTSDTPRSFSSSSSWDSNGWSKEFKSYKLFLCAQLLVTTSTFVSSAGSGDVLLDPGKLVAIPLLSSYMTVFPFGEGVKGSVGVFTNPANPPDDWDIPNMLGVLIIRRKWLATPPPGLIQPTSLNIPIHDSKSAPDVLANWNFSRNASQSRFFNDSLSFSFRPHTTNINASIPLSTNCKYNESTIFDNRPQPSPPPITNTVFRSL